MPDNKLPIDACISYAFNTLGKFTGAQLGGGGILFGSYFVIGIAAYFFMVVSVAMAGHAVGSRQASTGLGLVMAVCLISFLFMLIPLWLDLGLKRLNLGLYDSGNTNLGLMVTPAGPTLKILGMYFGLALLIILAIVLPTVVIGYVLDEARLNNAIPLLVFLALIVYVVLGCIVGVRIFMLAPFIILDRDCSLTEAVNMSWEMSRDNFWRLFALLLLNIVFTSAGSAICYIGLVAALPVNAAMFTYAYRYLSRPGVKSYLEMMQPQWAPGYPGMPPGYPQGYPPGYPQGYPPGYPPAYMPSPGVPPVVYPPNPPADGNEPAVDLEKHDE